MKLSTNEKRVFATLKTIVIFESVLYSVIYGILISLPKSYDSLSIYISVATITLLIQIILFFVKNSFFLRLLHKLTILFKKNDLTGQWNLVINYTTDTGSDIIRTGPCKIEESFLGLKITGDKIYDNITKNVEVDSWVAEKADVFAYESKVIFQYQYITYDRNTDNPTKLGIVNAEKINADKYEGIFKDYKVDSGKIIREGSVTLWRESV